GAFAPPPRFARRPPEAPDTEVGQMTNATIEPLATATGTEAVVGLADARKPDRKARNKAAKPPRRRITWDLIWAQRALLLMAVPLLLYQILFKYVPVYGWAIAFQDYKPGRGSIWNQEWVGFENFVN